MRSWKKVLLKNTDTLESAIQIIDAGGIRIALVTDTAGRLKGTITDGDIRRALLRHMGMDTAVIDFMNKNFVSASISDDREYILSIMKSKDLLHMPILDDKGLLVELETLSHLLVRDVRDNPVLLMAGGLGKRLRPLTKDIPKPLLMVGEKPLLETILMQFIESGFHNFYISTHFKAEMVRDYFGNGKKWGVDIRYLYEEKPLGTAGALGLFSREAKSNELPIVMMNGDLLTKINFEHLIDFHSKSAGIATMCVREYNFQLPYGVVTSDGHIVKGIEEKPIHNFLVNAGIYVLDPEVLVELDGKKHMDMTTLLELQIDKGNEVNVFPLHEYWLDIGNMKEYESAHKDYVENFGK